jgi:hypothetical protein
VVKVKKEGQVFSKNLLCKIDVRMGPENILFTIYKLVEEETSEMLHLEHGFVWC